MSGLINKSEGGSIYLSLYKGVVTQRVKSDTPGAIQRENKKGDIVFEKQFAGVGGYITSIRKKSVEFDGITQYQWEFTFTVRGGGKSQNYVLTIPESSRIGGQVMNRLPNVDFTKEVDLTTGEGIDKETGKPFQWAVLKQNGVKVEPAYTREAPNGLPPLQKIKVRGQEAWDNSDQLAFYDKVIENVIIPKIQAANPVTENELDNSDLPDLLEMEPSKYPSIDPKKMNTDIDVFGTPVNNGPRRGSDPGPETNDLPF